MPWDPMVPPWDPRGRRPYEKSDFSMCPDSLGLLTEVMAALQDMMAGGAPNPAKMMQYMQDPEIGPVLQKMMGAGQMPAMGGEL